MHPSNISGSVLKDKNHTRVETIRHCETSNPGKTQIIRLASSIYLVRIVFMNEVVSEAKIVKQGEKCRIEKMGCADSLLI